MKKLLNISSVLTAIVGIGLVVGGIWGMCFTYRSIARENIVTPADASISEKPVRGPFTLKAQADVIRKHTLTMTGGKTFAEMPRQIAKLDESGQPVMDAEGKPVMVANTARDIWITATTLTTALNMGFLSYAVCGLVLLFGLFLLWVAVLTRAYAKRTQLV
jgi:hypothetical protein